MNLSSRQHEEPQVNMTSLIDVVLLLLVFFMVTSSFVRESSVEIKLPEASSEAVSIGPSAGMMRRSGFTTGCVTFTTNCARGL